MTNNEFISLNDIRQELKILRLKKEISYEMIRSNKENFHEAVQPLNLVSKVIGPFKKIIVAYLFKKIFK
ncbi:hypothetical protein KIM67_17920 [Flagellimonas sp. 389]|uniref:DUF6327 family protein n=1 Tax=Flagellimonas sp. 389 TaxID=2835862 RepID=UPI001BD431A1|nr:DUF6327 family protein [Flagellimonas sp. 389]MBS9464306.1 hypothetical protein [Flagellimonas sp. 389]